MESGKEGAGCQRLPTPMDGLEKSLGKMGNCQGALSHRRQTSHHWGSVGCLGYPNSQARIGNRRC